MGNTFGHLFRITTWGESHGGGVGVVIDGCPPRIELSEADIQPDLDRRRPGQSTLVTSRKESDTVRILSGTFEGRTLGTPISLMVLNEDARPEAYSEMATKFRPSHADYTYQAKFGIRNWQGGGRSSARETVGRVAAGAVARKVLRQLHGTEIVACVQQVQRVAAKVDPELRGADCGAVFRGRAADGADVFGLLAWVRAGIGVVGFDIFGIHCGVDRGEFY